MKNPAARRSMMLPGLSCTLGGKNQGLSFVREMPCKASDSDFQDCRNTNIGPLGCPLTDDIFAARSHPDIRIARRAQTIASLARVISEREVSGGLRVTLLTQARRLELLANQRLHELGVQAISPKPEVG